MKARGMGKPEPARAPASYSTDIITISNKSFSAFYCYELDMMVDACDWDDCPYLEKCAAME